MVLQPDLNEAIKSWTGNIRSRRQSQRSGSRCSYSSSASSSVLRLSWNAQRQRENRSSSWEDHGQLQWWRMGWGNVSFSLELQWPSYIYLSTSMASWSPFSSHSVQLFNCMEMQNEVFIIIISIRRVTSWQSATCSGKVCSTTIRLHC